MIDNDLFISSPNPFLDCTLKNLRNLFETVIKKRGFRKIRFMCMKRNEEIP